MSTVERWCNEHKLYLSTEKTVGLMLKGKFDPERRPRIPILGKIIKFHNEVKYLGIILSERLFFTSDVKYIAGKARMAINNMSSVARANWGVGYKELIKIYKGTFIPIITYASPSWAKHLTKGQKGTLLAAQRTVAIRCFKGYRTTSLPASLVIAGMVKITDHIELTSIRYHHRKSMPCSIGPVEFHPQTPIKDKLKQLRTIQMQTWQEEWEHESRGRITFKYFPNLVNRLDAKWFVPDYYTSQLISGHGNIRSKLNQLRLADSDLCDCGLSETVQHNI